MYEFPEETRLILTFPRTRVNYLWRRGACARCKSAAAGSSCGLYRFECIMLHSQNNVNSPTTIHTLMIHTGFTFLFLYVFPSYLSSARYLSNLTPSSREQEESCFLLYPLIAAYSFSSLLLFTLPSSLSIFTSYWYLFL